MSRNCRPSAHRKNSYTPLHFVYDPYVVPILFEVTLHCVGCKDAKQVTLKLFPGVKQPPAIVPYNCAGCQPKRVRNEIEIISKRNPLAYGSFRAMTARCYCEGHTSYEHYGGRGITICPRWRGENGFTHFLSDMGERTPELSLDRIDVNGNYGPTNCRWATAKEQCNNKRNSKPITDADLAEMDAIDNMNRSGDEMNY
jgi:hypothetical protein